MVSLISYYSTFAEVNYTIDMLKFLYTIIETIMQSNCQQLQEMSNDIAKMYTTCMDMAKHDDFRHII